MRRQQELRLGDADALRAFWERLKHDRRQQLAAIYAELIERVVRSAQPQERRDEPIGK